MLLVVPAVLISLWAQFNVSTVFKKYKNVYALCGLTAEQTARRILDANGLRSVRIERVSGNLSDHYDPRTNVIRLSDSTYASTSVGAIGVAAHEAGHAIQHATDYSPIRIREAIIPITQIGSTLALPLAFLGFVMSWDILIYIGIILFGAVVLFQLVTLPVEFNASRRALASLEGMMILSEKELFGAKKVLRAAAMTYVAAMIVALANLLRLILLANRRR